MRLQDMLRQTKRSKGMKNNRIERLAHEILDERELRLASHLSMLLSNSRWDAGSLIEDILPVYCEKRGDSLYTLDPDSIYRPLYYLHLYGKVMNLMREFTRFFVAMTGAHLEASLFLLANTRLGSKSDSKTFGRIVSRLEKEEILSSELASQLSKFNETVNVPAKHFNAFYVPHSRLDKRTFSIADAALDFIMMRKLSMRLFELVKFEGVDLSPHWKEFREEWLSWNREMP